jgi:hypothetical protein
MLSLLEFLFSFIKGLMKLVVGKCLLEIDLSYLFFNFVIVVEHYPSFIEINNYMLYHLHFSGLLNKFLNSIPHIVGEVRHTF